MEFNFYSINGGWAKKTGSVMTSYYYDDMNVLSDSVSTRSSYFYDNPVHAQVTRTETVNSSGEVLGTRTYFPDDVHMLTGLSATERETIRSLGADSLHQVAVPVQVDSWIRKGNPPQRSPIGKQRTLFTKVSDSVVLPSKVQTAKAGDLLEDRLEYTLYDGKGNLLEARKSDGSFTAYLWGHGRRYPVAKIDNARFAEVASAMALTEDRLRDFGVTDFGLLELLRPGLPKAHVSTYGYRPLVGMVSARDPSGYRMSYEYDLLNRLERTRDNDGNIETEHFYHYRGNPLELAMVDVGEIQGDDFIFTGRSSNFSVLAGGTSANYSYSWRVEHTTAPVITGTGPSIGLSLGTAYRGHLQLSCRVHDNATGNESTRIREILVYDPVPGGTVDTGGTGFIDLGSTRYTFRVFPVGGSGNFSYLWSFHRPGGSRIGPEFPGGDRLVHNFPESLGEGPIQVRCRITDNVTGQRAEYSSAALPAHPPLTLGRIGHPSHVGAVDADIRFSVAAGGGSGNRRYDWSFSRAPRLNRSTTVPNLSVRFNGPEVGPMTVSVRAVDLVTGASVTDNADLTVSPPFRGGTASVDDADQRLLVGTTARFRLSGVNGGIAPYTYRWRMEKTGSAFRQVFSGGDVANITITEAMVGNVQVYCEVTDSRGATANSVAVAVEVRSPIPGEEVPIFNGFSTVAGPVTGDMAALSVDPLMDGAPEGLLCSWEVDLGDGNGFVETSNDPRLELSLPCGGSAVVRCTVLDPATGITAAHTETMTATCN